MRKNGGSSAGVVHIGYSERIKDSSTPWMSNRWKGARVNNL